MYTNASDLWKIIVIRGAKGKQLQNKNNIFYRGIVRNLPNYIFNERKLEIVLSYKYQNM